MILLYVVPRILYGLETQVLGRTQVTRLEDYRTLLRRIQSLSERVAKQVVYLLMGVLLLEALLHMCMIKLLQKIANNKSSLLYEIALRQLAVKELNPIHCSSRWWSCAPGTISQLQMQSSNSNPKMQYGRSC